MLGQFFKFLIFYLAVFFYGFSGIGFYADEIKLANGQSVTGKILSDEGDEYLIEMSIGSMRLKKVEVLSITKTEKSENNIDDNKLKFTQCESIDDFYQLAIQAVDDKDIILLGRVINELESIFKNKPDPDFEQKIMVLSNKAAKSGLDEANVLFQEGSPRRSVLKINEILEQIQNSNWTSTLKALKKKCYEVMLSDEASMTACQQVIDSFNLYETDSNVSGKSPSRSQHSSKKGKNSGVSSVSLLKQHEKWIPEITPIIGPLLEVSHWKQYIEENEWHIWSGKSIHSVDALNKSRGNLSQFNQLRSENNQVYNARRVCNQYNRSVLNLRNNWAQLKSKIEYQEQYMQKQGFEKIYGEWLGGEDMKTAKGWVKYRGQWLDPSSSDFQREKNLLDEQASALFKKEKLEETPPPVKNVPNPVSRDTQTQQKEQEVNTSDFDIDEMVASGNSGYLVKHVSDKITTETQDFVDEKVKGVKDQLKDSKSDFEEVTEESGGMSTSTGVLLIIGIMAFLFYYKRSQY